MKIDLHPSDLSALVARIAGLSILATDATFVSSVNSLFGAHGAQIIAVIGLITTVAADFIRIQSVPAATVINSTVVTTQTNTNSEVK